MIYETHPDNPNPRAIQKAIAALERGELIAYAIGTNEILGYRRGFARTAVGAHGVGWEFTSVCPKYEFRGGRSKDFDFGLWFLSDVLRPVGVAEYRAEISQKP